MPSSASHAAPDGAADRVSRAAQPSHRGLIAILGMLAAFAPMATDMYLPGFAQIAAHFGVDQGGVEITLSLFFLGLAVGQAVYGPLMDRWGRRGPLLVGIGLYVLATAGCLLAPDIGSFTALRFLQAAGGAAGMIVGRAIVTDLFTPRESARALSMMMAVMTMAPVVAPVLGGWLITHLGWRSVFYAMLAFGLVCAVAVLRAVPETLPRERRQAQGLGGVLRTWRGLLGQRDFVVPAVVGGLTMACMFAFITGSPFVFIQLHGASPQAYGGLFALIACALIVFAQINRRALLRRSPRRLLGVGLMLNVVAGAGTVLAAGTSWLPALLLPLWVAIGSLGFIGANAAALAMSAARGQPGSGSSLIGMLQFGLATLVSSAVAHAQNGTAYPMTLAIVACGSLAALLWFTQRPAAEG